MPQLISKQINDTPESFSDSAIWNMTTYLKVKMSPGSSCNRTTWCLMSRKWQRRTPSQHLEVKMWWNAAEKEKPRERKPRRLCDLKTLVCVCGFFFSLPRTEFPIRYESLIHSVSQLFTLITLRLRCCASFTILAQKQRKRPWLHALCTVFMCTTFSAMKDEWAVEVDVKLRGL